MTDSIKDKSKSTKATVSKKMAPIKKVVVEQLSAVKVVLPLVVAILTLGLTATDQVTDILSSIKLCTTQCGCEWNEMWGCYPPADGVCGGSVFNGTAAGEYCFYDTLPHTGSGGISERRRATEETCAKKAPYSPPTTPTCQCWWSYWGPCHAPRGTCTGMDVNGTDGDSYCSSIDSKSQCEDSSSSWLLPAIHQLLPGVRHPVWCLTSVGTLIGPSLISNLMLLIM